MSKSHPPSERRPGGRDATLGAARFGATRLGPLLRLRPTLVATIVGLVLLTAAAVGGSIGMLTVASTRTLIDQTRDAAVAAAVEHARDFFETAPRNTDELVREARRGLLPLDRPRRLAALFAERLRDRPQLAWIGYGEAASGRYVGATRYESGEIVEEIADPAVAGGVPWQAAVAPDGTLSRPSVTQTAPYFVAKRGWFRHGLSVAGPAWTRFYQFAENRGPGITCTTRYTAPGAKEPTGVFDADLLIRPIGAFLSTLRVGPHGAVFLVDRNGRRLVSPIGGFAAAAGKALDVAAAQAGSALSTATTRVQSGGGLYQVVYAPVPVTGNPGFDVAVVVDLADMTAGLAREALAAGLVAFLAMALAIAIGVFLSGRIARPVVAIAEDLASVGAFRISRLPAPRSFVREIAELGHSVDRMKASLRSFGRYVPTDLVRTLLAAGQEAELGGETRRLSIFFSDVADFTGISEGMAPSALVAAMGRYFAMMTEAITAQGGTVDKFMGDGIMAFFNAPNDLPDHPRRACMAALAAQSGLARVIAESDPGTPVFRTRIGLGLGAVLVGNIGTPERFAYTVLGDEVNLASRLEALNKVYGTAIMADEGLVAEAGDGFEWRRLDRVAVKGRHQGTRVYELLGERGTLAAEILAARDVYERALDAYFAGDFAAAGTGFAAAVAARPDDLAARVMAERAAAFAAAPPTDWTGIHVMHEK